MLNYEHLENIDINVSQILIDTSKDVFFYIYASIISKAWCKKIVI